LAFYFIFFTFIYISMRVLLSSTACAPYGGSEGIYGWRACKAIAQNHEVWVILDFWNKEGIDKARIEGLVPDSMHFVYVGRPVVNHPNRLIARLESWISYIHFQKQALKTAQDLIKEQDFDLVHHVTYTSWRVGSPLWKLPLPFIWGPISGTELFPLSCLSILSLNSLCFELFRICMNFISKWSPSVRACARRSTHLVAVHSQAQSFLSGLRGTDQGLSIYNGFFMDQQRVTDLERNRGYSSPSEPLRLFAAGNLEGRKGIAIALQALALLKRRNIPFYYHVSSRGPELKYLLTLTQKLNISDSVVLGHSFASGEYEKMLKSFDVYLLPSLREGGGLTMMEAMLAGAVPIVADCGGPGDTVQEDHGFKIKVTEPRIMAQDIAQALETLHFHRELLSQMGSKARDRIAETYGEETFRKNINNIYHQLI
jgi:glycosyltransferase involved in cell wall biosynthesis